MFISQEPYIHIHIHMHMHVHVHVHIHIHIHDMKEIGTYLEFTLNFL